MGRANFELIKFIFKQRWFQQLFYWISIAFLAFAFLWMASVIFYEPESSELIYGILLNIGFWGLMVFLMRRQLKK